jgi:hypothetical protein
MSTALKVFHLFPAEEAEVHEAAEDCLCGPELVSPHRIDDECRLRGEVCWEHQRFSPASEGETYQVVEG